MILAAGFGTRLHPFTQITPKPLFTVSGRAIIDIIIQNLHLAGFEAVIINTHQLYDKIERHIDSRNYPISVQVRREVEILGTGGAIKNVADFMDHEPFMVVNGDLFTDIDFKAVYDFHLSHPQPVTLVLYDDPEFNTVSVTHDGFVIAFNLRQDATVSQDPGGLTFTGIQVIDPEMLSFIPQTPISSIIEAYQKMLNKQGLIRAFIPIKSHWKDIGTPKRYQAVVFDEMAKPAFDKAWPDSKNASEPIERVALQGDGSNRRWFRLNMGDRSLILADHGIKNSNNTSEVEAFIHINSHLSEIQIPVPRIYASDFISGMVFMEDLGDTHLQDKIRHTKKEDTIVSYYRTVVDHLIRMNTKGAEKFDLSWAYQTPAYTKELILEKECRYFVEAFVNRFLGWQVSYDKFAPEFMLIADSALKHAVTGLMHRDFQSRNIMIKNETIYFIDFQGARIGPIQYDLASLLIDPYVSLPIDIQDQIFKYCLESLSAVRSIDPDRFSSGYYFCALARNLQILGAFSHLSLNCHKNQFVEYIPQAVKSLKCLLKTENNSENQFQELRTLMEKVVI